MSWACYILADNDDGLAVDMRIGLAALRLVGVGGAIPPGLHGRGLATVAVIGGGAVMNSEIGTWAQIVGSQRVLLHIGTLSMYDDGH